MIWTSGKLLSGLNLLTSIISQVGLVYRLVRFMHSMHVIHMSNEYPLYTRKITSFPLFHYNPTHPGSPRMNSLWLGGTCGTTQSGDPLGRDRNSGLPTCLSPLKQCWSGPWTKTSSTVGKTTTHASLPLLIGPTMLCCLAKILPREKPSRLTMAQLQVSFLDSTSTKSFYVELLSLLRGPATVQVFNVNLWLNFVSDIDLF